MSRTTKRNWAPALALAVAVIAACWQPVAAQKKLAQDPGSYHGELDFQISWKRYYRYAEWTKLMQDMQKQYSQLADIASIGKSRMGRDQYLLTITNKATGSPESKTAMWVDGAIHGNEINGVTCSLYLAWYLLTRYEYDPFIHELVDTRTFYILPGLNVDANDSYAGFPNTENDPREPYRPEDNDGDGLYDEDRVEDVDGDGEISAMYVEDPDGDFWLTPDKRRFVRATERDEAGRRFRRIGQEGFDNDGDGRINEDDIGGPDPNRNFPYAWNLQAGWPYPLSEVETRNVYEFQRKHPNIFAGFHYHNTGRLVMFAAPPDVRARSMTPEQRREQETRVGAQLAEMRQSNKYAQLFSRLVAPEYQHDMDTQVTIVTQGARLLKDYTPTISGLTGQAQANDYYMLGAYGYLIELWGRAVYEADLNNDGRVDDEEYMQWIDGELMGEGWINPHQFKHPDLGDIWIGGSARKHIERTPPARYIETEALRNANFVLYCVSQFPRVEIDRVEVTPATGDLYWIDAVVKNDRVYPSSSDRAIQLGIAVKDKIAVRSSENITILDLPPGTSQLDSLNPQGAAATVAAGKPTEFRIKGREDQRFRCLARISGASGWVEFQVESKYGGKAARRVALNSGGK
jgi:hypothetical protein